VRDCRCGRFRIAAAIFLPLLCDFGSIASLELRRGNRAPRDAPSLRGTHHNRSVHARPALRVSLSSSGCLASLSVGWMCDAAGTPSAWPAAAPARGPGTALTSLLQCRAASAPRLVKAGHLRRLGQSARYAPPALHARTTPAALPGRPGLECRSPSDRDPGFDLDHTLCVHRS
jgi:hypothetical protein